MNAQNIAIVGATGAVGVEILRVLERRNFPVASLKLLASARSAGKTLEFKGKPHKVEEPSKVTGSQEPPRSPVVEEPHNNGAAAGSHHVEVSEGQPRTRAWPQEGASRATGLHPMKICSPKSSAIVLKNSSCPCH